MHWENMIQDQRAKAAVTWALSRKGKDGSIDMQLVDKKAREISMW